MVGGVGDYSLGSSPAPQSVKIKTSQDKSRSRHYIVVILPRYCRDILLNIIYIIRNTVITLLVIWFVNCDSNTARLLLGPCVSVGNT